MVVYKDYTAPNAIVTNEHAINNSIRNIILTRINSLPGKPDFGSNVMYTLFELMDGSGTDDYVKTSIIEAILKWEPRISLIDIIVKEIPEYNKIVIDIIYEYKMQSSDVQASTSITVKI